MTDKIKVLCVEDEIDIRENLVAILESEGFEVFEAGDGNEGLEAFLEKNPDIIVSDIMMPNLDGHGFLKAIRTNQNIPNNNVPFILLSALGQKEDIIKGIGLEASDYLVKPVDFDVLIAKIKEKAGSAKKNREGEIKKIDNLKTQVANIVPQEMLQYIELISRISEVLKSEPYGPLPHKKYLDDLNKVYIHSLKLKTMIGNFLSGESISNQLDVQDEIMHPVKFMKNFVDHLNEKFKQKIKVNSSEENTLPQIKVSKQILVELTKKIIGSIFKMDKEIEINISIAHDPLNRIAIIFYTNHGVDEEAFKEKIDNVIPSESLDSQGFIIETSFSENRANLILLVPDYRVLRA